MERLDQYGYFKMLVRHWLPPLKCNNLAVSSQAKTLTLADVQSASYIAIFGISLTIITVVLEKIWMKYSIHLKNKRDQSILNNKTDTK